jgi:hypothetical protein
MGYDCSRIKAGQTVLCQTFPLLSPAVFPVEYLNFLALTLLLFLISLLILAS